MKIRLLLSVSSFFRNKASIKIQLFCLLFLSSFTIASAQTTTTHTNPQTGVRITTKTTPIPSLSEQVKDMEAKVEWAKMQPDMVQNGTLAKYEYALEQKRKQLAEENAERSTPVKSEN